MFEHGADCRTGAGAGGQRWSSDQEAVTGKLWVKAPVVPLRIPPLHKSDAEAKPLLWVEHELMNGSGCFVGVPLAAVVLVDDPEATLEALREG